MPVMIIAGLGAGIGLDRLLGTGPFFTLVMIVVSVPVSLFIAVRMLLDGIRRAPTVASEAEKEVNS